MPKKIQVKPAAPPPERATPSPAGWRAWLGRGVPGATLVLAAVAAYHNSLDAPFLFDDTPAIVDNRTIRHLWPPWEALSPPARGAGVTGRPLVNLSLAVNYAFGGLNVRGYHATNLALHILAALTLWGVLRRTLTLLPCRSLLAGDGLKRSTPESPASRLLHENAGSMAWSAALLWTVHPLLTESVVCVVQRNEVMGGLFYLLTLYCFVRSVSAAPELASAGFGVGAALRRDSDKPSRPKAAPTTATVRWWLVLAVLSSLLGMASKEIVATAPLLVLLYDRTFIAGTFRSAWQRRRLFYGALAATWLLLAWLMIHARQRGGTVGFGLGVSSWEYLLTQCRALTIYLKLSFWPHPLVADYGEAVVKNAGEVWWQGLLVLALLTATAAVLWRKPVAGFLGAWFFVILAPSSSFVPLTTQTIAEHRMYLPLAAVIVLAVAGLYTLAGRRTAVVCLALALGLGAITVHRNGNYGDLLAFWTDTVAQQPENARAHVSLGSFYAKLERWPEAIAQYEEALRLQPANADAHNNLGTAFMTLGRSAEGMAQFEQALESRPEYAEAERNLGLGLVTAGRTAEAIPHFEKAVRINPAYGEAELYWAIALATTARFPEAVPHFEKAVALEPDSVDAHKSYGRALLHEGRLEEAIAQYADALRLNPNHAEAHRDLALALHRAGRMEESLQHAREALRLNPALGPGK